MVYRLFTKRSRQIRSYPSTTVKLTTLLCCFLIIYCMLPLTANPCSLRFSLLESRSMLPEPTMRRLLWAWRSQNLSSFPRPTVLGCSHSFTINNLYPRTTVHSRPVAKWSLKKFQSLQSCQTLSLLSSSLNQARGFDTTTAAPVSSSQAGWLTMGGLPILPSTGKKLFTVLCCRSIVLTSEMRFRSGNRENR